MHLSILGEENELSYKINNYSCTIIYCNRSCGILSGHSGYSHDVPVESQQYQYKFESKAVKDENNRQIHQALFSYSHDYGDTWTEPENLSHDEATFTSMIIHGNKPYLTWHEQYTVWLADSDDNGVTIKKKPLWSGAHPQLASFGDKLFVTWMTEDPKYHMAINQHR